MYVFVGHFLATEIFIGQCLEAEVVEVTMWCLGWVALQQPTKYLHNKNWDALGHAACYIPILV